MTKTLKSLALALIPIAIGVTIGCCIPVHRHSDDKPSDKWCATNGFNSNGQLVITNADWKKYAIPDCDVQSVLSVTYRSAINGKSIIECRDPDNKLWLGVKWTGGTTDDVWKDFYPTNVEIICSHEPVVTNKNGEWIIRFKP